MPTVDLEQERHMITHQDLWPRWPMLPLKRRNPNGGVPECATMLASGPPPFVVYKVGIYEFTELWSASNAVSAAAWQKEFNSMPREEFMSVDALLAAGWVVD